MIYVPVLTKFKGARQKKQRRWLGFLTALSFVGVVSATGSADTNTSLKAVYRVTNYENDRVVSENEVKLFRNHQQVAYEYKNKGVTELWERMPNGRVHLIRFFNDAKRGIEYQSNEIKGDNNWDVKYYLVSNVLRQAASNPDNRSVLRKQFNDGLVELEWANEWQLPRVLTVTTGLHATRWALISSHFNKNEVGTYFATLDHYATTDYADIGDSESDPFLMKMIKLGFIEHGHAGFYNADGQAIDDGHHH